MPVYYGRGLPPEEYEPQVAREDELGWFLPPLRSLPVMRSKRWVIDTGTDRVWIPDPTLGGYQPCGAVYDGAHYLLPVDKRDEPAGTPYDIIYSPRPKWAHGSNSPSVWYLEEGNDFSLQRAMWYTTQRRLRRPCS